MSLLVVLDDFFFVLVLYCVVVEIGLWFLVCNVLFWVFWCIFFLVKVGEVRWLLYFGCLLLFELWYLVIDVSIWSYWFRLNLFKVLNIIFLLLWWIWNLFILFFLLFKFEIIELISGNLLRGLVVLWLENIKSFFFLIVYYFDLVLFLLEMVGLIWVKSLLNIVSVLIFVDGSFDDCFLVGVFFKL